MPVVIQELGSIDPHAVEQTEHRLEPQLERCHAEGRARVAFLAGDVKVFLRIDSAGKVRRGHLEASTLGDHETERCILSVFTTAIWPRPIGGDAEVRHSFGWGPGAERTPIAWTSEKVIDALLEDRETKRDVDKCRAAHRGAFQVTAYVSPDGGKSGRFRAIGVVSPDKDPDKHVECIVDALKSLRLPSPGDRAAKVSFSL